MTFKHPMFITYFDLLINIALFAMSKLYPKCRNCNLYIFHGFLLHQVKTLHGYPTYRQNHTYTTFLDFGLDLKEIKDVFLQLGDITFNSAPSRKIFEMFDRDDFH